MWVFPITVLTLVFVFKGFQCQRLASWTIRQCRRWCCCRCARVFCSIEDEDSDEETSESGGRGNVDEERGNLSVVRVIERDVEEMNRALAGGARDDAGGGGVGGERFEPDLWRYLAVQRDLERRRRRYDVGEESTHREPMVELPNRTRVDPRRHKIRGNELEVSRRAHLHHSFGSIPWDQGESSPPKGILRAATMLALSVSTAALVAPRLDFGMTHAARMAALERSPATCMPAVAPCRPRAELVTMAAPPSETSEPFPITRYSSQDWWRVLKELPSSAVLVRIAPRMAANVVVATLVAWLRVAGLLRLSFPALPHQLAGAFLGLLVTFRTNSAYARFWEARCIWGKVRGVTEALAIGAATYVAPRAPEHARAIVEAVAEYPPALARTCKTQPGQPDRGRAAGRARITDMAHRPGQDPPMCLSRPRMQCPDWNG